MFNLSRGPSRDVQDQLWAAYSEALALMNKTGHDGAYVQKARGDTPTCLVLVVHGEDATQEALMVINKLMTAWDGLPRNKKKKD